jgi:hypothetical protein
LLVVFSFASIDFHCSSQDKQAKMFRAFVRLLQSQQLIQADASLVVAVSGGADSIALLHLFATLGKASEWPLRLTVAHLNHGLRGDESDADADFVLQFARQLGVDCVVDQRDITVLSASRGTGIEETSRNERYAFFERVCLLRGASAGVDIMPTIRPRPCPPRGARNRPPRTRRHADGAATDSGSHIRHSPAPELYASETAEYLASQ